jgi:hypothetical protein
VHESYSIYALRLGRQLATLALRTSEQETIRAFQARAMELSHTDSMNYSITMTLRHFSCLRLQHLSLAQRQSSSCTAQNTGRVSVSSPLACKLSCC